MLIITAIIAFATDIYTLFTWKKRTWGGVRSNVGSTRKQKHHSVYSINSQGGGEMFNYGERSNNVYYNTGVQEIETWTSETNDSIYVSGFV